MTCSRWLMLWALVVIHNAAGDTDKPCAARQMANQSVVCVCTEEYCDTIKRENPHEGEFWIYTSSKVGNRFEKSHQRLQSCAQGSSTSLNKRKRIEAKHQSFMSRLISKRLNLGNKQRRGESSSSPYLEVFPSRKYRDIEGFGTSPTDSAGINLNSLESEQLRQYLIDSYFAASGIELNMMRLPIGGTDFSPRGYTYNDLPEDDKTLSNFSLTCEDHKYKIPYIKAAMKVATDKVHIVASSWSPPAWMKHKETLSSLSRLKKEYYPLYAQYHLKFLEAYDNAGIPIWAVTPTNEPLNGVMSVGKTNRLSFDVKSMGEWIAEDLGPTIKNSSKYSHVKILAGDDQTFSIVLWFYMVLTQVKEALQYIDGVAFHFYYNYLIPAGCILDSVMKDYPDKILISTEAAAGVSASDDEKVLLGAWDRAENYVDDIIEDLNNNVTGWIDWNMCLNQKGGPSWVDNYVDSAIIVNADDQEFYKQPTFYAIGHFSKFIPRGSTRVHVTASYKNTSIKHVAFVTPRDTIVVVLLNTQEDDSDLTIKVGGQEAELSLDAKSITTVELKC